MMDIFPAILTFDMNELTLGNAVSDERRAHEAIRVVVDDGAGVSAQPRSGHCIQVMSPANGGSISFDSLDMQLASKMMPALLNFAVGMIVETHPDQRHARMAVYPDPLVE